MVTKAQIRPSLIRSSYRSTYQKPSTYEVTNCGITRRPFNFNF